MTTTVNVPEILRPEDSPRSLRKRGFQLFEVSPFINWKFVETTEEYDAVVQLRTKAYAGKIDPNNNQLMRDQYDQDAHILAGWHYSKAVASLRIMVHPAERLWEHEQYISLDTPDIPPKRQTAEITRVCTDPAWRGSNLSKLLFQQTTLAVLRLEKRYLLGSSTTALLPLYIKIGCRPTTVQFDYPGLGGIHTIFLADLVSALNGYDAPFGFWPVWSVMWSGIQQTAVREGILPRPPALQTGHLAFWRLLKPVFERLSTHNRAKRRHR
jgi:predicted GNAT family N-acyltransferase